MTTMDFAFIVHPRNIQDITRAYPALSGVPEAELLRAVQDTSVHVIGNIEWTHQYGTVSGELIAVPLGPDDLLTRRDRACRVLVEVLDHCEARGAHIAGLGGLLPSACRAGRSLKGTSRRVGVTTGHSFTAVMIAEYVREVERARGSGQRIAVLGAAGSTGRAAVRWLVRDHRLRNLTLIDLPGKHAALCALASEIDGDVQISTDLAAVRQANILVCVTNARNAIIGPELLAPGCVVVDDAQPENVSLETARARPDVTVIKCLAHLPRLSCNFDFGLFAPHENVAKQSHVFTCLAEAALLASVDHVGDYTIGDPTTVQMAHMAELARGFGIGIPALHSFPEIGEVKIA